LESSLSDVQSAPRWRAAAARWPEPGKTLLSCFDHATRADSNEIRRQESRGSLRGLCMQPLIFYAKDGSGRSPGLLRRLRGCIGEQRNREHQAGDESLPHQILMKIFFR
jgi:hypothetical protein